MSNCLSSGKSVANACQYGGDKPMCLCMLQAEIWTTKNGFNIGSRFYCCRNYADKVKSCGYFDWIDEPFPDQARVTIMEQVFRAKELKQKLNLIEMQLAEALKTTRRNAESPLPYIVDDVAALQRSMNEIKGYVMWTCRIVWLIFFVLVIRYVFRG